MLLHCSAEVDGEELARPNRYRRCSCKHNVFESSIHPGKVHIVTGGYVGCGYELTKMLYENNATVYVAGRSKDKGDRAINAMKQEFPNSKGRLEFLMLDLSKLDTIKASAEEFLSKESRLDVLTNNAGVMNTPTTEKDSTGHELQVGTNCIGPWLFTQCLIPILKKTAATAPTGSVRVTWAASLAALLSKTGGIQFDQKSGQTTIFPTIQYNYMQSKAGNVYLASETARRYGKDGIISTSWNPGNLKTELGRHMSAFERFLLIILLFPAKFGGYTELFAGWSDEITASQNGAFIVPWGQVGNLRADLITGQKPESEGGTGVAQKFWEYCEKETKQYA